MLCAGFAVPALEFRARATDIEGTSVPDEPVSILPVLLRSPLWSIKQGWMCR
jgi:hypothetical protein